jgi:DNA-binding response OmpR family regulator
MPNLDGLALGSQVRTFDRDIPIIYITALDDKENMLKAINIGVLDFIIKPFDQEIVLLRIKNAIKIRRARISEMTLLRTLHEALGIVYDSSIEDMDLDKKFQYMNELTTILGLQFEQKNRKNHG